MTEFANTRVAVMGCGAWGRNLVRNFHQLGVLTAVCDANAELARQIAGQFGVADRPAEEVLADPRVTALVIAAPAERHFALAKAGLLAGKHLFVEKPLAMNVAEAEALCRLAEEKQRALMVGHLLQYHPAFLRLKELVHAGELGRLQYLYSNRLNLGKVRHEENILWSFAPHDISMILSLVGEEPEAVTATGAAYLQKVIADVTTTHLAFANGVHAHIFVSWLHPFKEQKLVVIGEGGMAVFDDGEPWERKIAVYSHRVEWIEGKPRTARGEPEYHRVEEMEPLRMECRHFLECCTSGAVPRTDGREALRVLKVLDRAQGFLPAAAPAPPRHDGIFVHETARIDAPCEIAAGTRIWHFSHILPHCTLGEKVIVGQNVVIGPSVTVGRGCKIQNNVSLYKGVTLEEDVFCGPSCVFTNVLTPRAHIERKHEFLPTLVRRGATIGANATIVCGHTLGAYCMVAAGAVVTRDVPAHALVAGVPARRIGWVSHAGEVLNEDLVCPREGRRYRLAGEERLEELV